MLHLGKVKSIHIKDYFVLVTINTKDYCISCCFHTQIHTERQMEQAIPPRRWWNLMLKEEKKKHAWQLEHYLVRKGKREDYMIYRGNAILCFGLILQNAIHLFLLNMLHICSISYLTFLAQFLFRGLISQYCVLGTNYFFVS